jgi:multicomponent K+:H+ antiporter subunit G
MTPAELLPAWAALLVALLVLIGGGLALTGAVGTLKLATFFERIHAPTLGTSWGTGAIVLASILCFSVLGSRLAVHEILIGIFVTVTTPVTLMLLARAVLYRERAEGREGVPPRSIAFRRAEGKHPEDM